MKLPVDWNHSLQLSVVAEAVWQEPTGTQSSNGGPPYAQQVCMRSMEQGSYSRGMVMEAAAAAAVGSGAAAETVAMAVAAVLAVAVAAVLAAAVEIIPVLPTRQRDQVPVLVPHLPVLPSSL